MEKLVLIDGNSLLNRAFYATPVFTTKDGLPTNGVFGFVKLLLKIIADKQPTHFAVAFDLHAPTFRHKIYADYKAGRKPMPDDLAKQFPVLKDVLRAMGICICEMPGFEADDVIGTLAKKFQIPTFIYTGDRDAYQLVDDTTNVCFTKKGVSDILELSVQNFKDEIGLTPSQIIDLKSLMGDKSDNIPGVAGVGEKSAHMLIEKYENLDGIYAHLDEITGALNKKLTENKETAYFSRTLATIDVHAPIDVSLADCIVRTPFTTAVRDKFVELEFKSLLAKENFVETPSTSLKTGENLQKLQDIKEVTPDTFNAVIDAYNTSKADAVAFHLDVSDVRVAFADAPSVEYVLPLKQGLLDVGYYSYELVPLYKTLFEGKKTVISYNMKDLMKVLSEQDVAVFAPIEDVAVLKCIADGLSNSDGLEFCLEYHDFPSKNKASGLLYLQNKYYTALRDEEKRLYKDVELPLIFVLFAMEKQGICVNETALREFSEKYNKELSSLVERIYELAGEPFNVNSTQQLGKILFEKLHVGAGVKKNKDSKNYKTTAEELEKYADDYEIVRLLLRYRKIQKINSTYVEGFKPFVKNGKVHTTYNQTNTQTGRLSSANPNIQNIPIRTEEGRELRKLFTASEGNVLLDADYSQIELRLLAHFSGCKELVLAYCNGDDIHALTASQVFNVPIEQVTSEMRRRAKAVNFGIIYGISAFGLSNDLNISTKEAQEYIRRYFESYSDVQGYMQGNVESATKDGYVETLLGRRRVINELQSSNRNVRAFGERAAMNMPLQGSSADIIKIAMINVYKKLQEGKYKAKLVLQVHDELVIDCPIDEVDEVSAILKTEMENAVQLRVPLTVEVNTGKTWFDTK